MPELFFKTRGYNDQSGLLWNENGKIWFFGGGRDISNYVPFRLAVSKDNGVNWTYSIPQLDKPATDYTAQPITNAFRAPDGSIYFSMDADNSQSFCGIVRTTEFIGKIWADAQAADIPPLYQ
jgi:hypothetical protein